MAEDGAAVFSVVFSDGERETNVGSIKIHPSTQFDNFEQTLCQRIGLSPNQITTFLIDGDERRRIPITGEADFSALAAAGGKKKPGCSFLVLLRRSRRRSRPRQQQRQRTVSQYGGVLAPENYRLLRRDSTDLINNPYVYDRGAALRYRELKVQMENYERIMTMTMDPGLDPGRVGGSGFRDSSAPKGMYCGECARARAEGRAAEAFHCCVFDDVIVGFRSKAGPVGKF